VLVDDTSAWPVVRVGDRHVFQTGAQGGVEPPDTWPGRTPRAPDEQAPTAEWVADPGFGAAVAAWCPSMNAQPKRQVNGGSRVLEPDRGTAAGAAVLSS
jgi:hypothetical protein